MEIVLCLNYTPHETALSFAARAGWHLQTVSTTLTAPHLKKLVDFWHPVGALVCLDGEKHAPPDIFGRLPTVFLTCDAALLPPRAQAVLYDSRETGRLGARELLMLNRTSFAYVHPAETPVWSREREEGYREALAVNGRTADVFRPTRGGLGYQKDLRAFLAALPKPCALFAANDLVGADVLGAAGILGLSVPEELAVLGVDDIRSICEHTRPLLSSIRPDFPRGGEIAAILLRETLARRSSRTREKRHYYGPVGVTHRASTRLTRKADPFVSAALDLIAGKACTGLMAREVAKTFPCARPVAEARFRKATGHSILEEIHAVRLERIKELLESSSQQIKSLHDFCGFASENALRRFFLRKTGMTMSAWRNRRRTAL